MTNFRTHPMAALAVLVLGLFMTLLDLTIVNIAIPSILDGLHASLDQVLWVLNAYSLFYAVLLITSARLGDIYGPRNLFAVGVVIFTVASGFTRWRRTWRSSSSPAACRASARPCWRRRACP